MCARHVRLSPLSLSRSHPCRSCFAVRPQFISTTTRCDDFGAVSVSLPCHRANTPLPAASASLGFPFPVPAMAAAGWRGYLFANLGNLTTWNTPLRHYKRDTRVSVGVSTAWSFMGECALLLLLFIVAVVCCCFCCFPSGGSNRGLSINAVVPAISKAQHVQESCSPLPEK